MASADQRLTKTAEIIGTPLYMSPKQCSGSETDSRSDLYSLGCVLFEVLAGQPPFNGTQPMEIILKHVQDTPPAIKIRRPTALKEITYKLLNKNPDDRYSSGSELTEALKNADLSDFSDPTVSRFSSSRIVVVFAILVLMIAGACLTTRNVKGLKRAARKAKQAAISEMKSAMDKGHITEAQKIFDAQIDRKINSDKIEPLLAQLMEKQRLLGHKGEARNDSLAQIELLALYHGVHKARYRSYPRCHDCRCCCDEVRYTLARSSLRFLILIMGEPCFYAWFAHVR